MTTVRDLGDRSFHTLAFRGRPGLPRIVASGPPLTTQAGTDTPLAAAVAQHAERGVDVIIVSGLTAHGSRIDDDLLEEVANRGVYVDLTLGNDRALYAQMMTTLPPPLAEPMARLGIPNVEAFYTDRIGLLRRLHAHGVPVVTGLDSA